MFAAQAHGACALAKARIAETRQARQAHLASQGGTPVSGGPGSINTVSPTPVAKRMDDGSTHTPPQPAPRSIDERTPLLVERQTTTTSPSDPAINEVMSWCG